MIDLLERIVLRFERQDSLTQKLTKVEGFLVERGLPLAETVPLFCSLLSIPLGAEYVSPDMPAEQQKRQTMRALMTIPFRRAEKQPVMLIFEDLHWIDPTTLEYLNMLVDAIPTAPSWRCSPAVPTSIHRGSITPTSPCWTSSGCQAMLPLR